MHSGGTQFVVTSYWSFICTVKAWETVEAPAIGFDGGSGNSNDVRTASVRRSRRTARRRPAPRLMLEYDGPRRRAVLGAAGRSPREAADRYPSGVRRPAGTARGNRPVPRRPACRPSGSSSAWSRSVSRQRPRGGTGRGCSKSSPTRSTTAAFMTVTSRIWPWRCATSSTPTAGAPMFVTGAAAPPFRTFSETSLEPAAHGALGLASPVQFHRRQLPSSFSVSPVAHPPDRRQRDLRFRSSADRPTAQLEKDKSPLLTLPDG